MSKPDVIITEAKEVNQYGDTVITGKDGNIYKIGAKRKNYDELVDQFQEGYATNVNWSNYKGHDFISEATLVKDLLPDKSVAPASRPPDSITAAPAERMKPSEPVVKSPGAVVPQPQRSYSDGAAIGMVTNRIGSHIDNNTLELVFKHEEIGPLMTRYRKEVFHAYGLDFDPTWPEYKAK